VDGVSLWWIAGGCDDGEAVVWLIEMQCMHRPHRDPRASGCSHKGSVLPGLHRQTQNLWELPEVTTVAKAVVRLIEMQCM